MKGYSGSGVPPSLSLLAQVSDSRLDELVSRYRSVLLLAKLVLGCLGFMLFLFVISDSALMNGVADATFYLGTGFLAAILMMAVFVAMAFSRLHALTDRVGETALSLGVDEVALKNELKTYLYSIIGVHYGISGW